MEKAEAPDKIRKYGVTLTPQLVSEIDAAAKRETMSRSGFVRQTLRQALRQKSQQEAQNEKQ